MCLEIDRIVVTTDSSEIAEVAEKFGAFIINRPADLAEDTTPMWPVVKHALQSIEEIDQKRYESVILLQPTSPFRNPQDIQNAFTKLNQVQNADGIVSVSIPRHNPYWYSVIETDGWMEGLIPDAEKINRRQDVPEIFNINGLFYIWKRNYIFTVDNWRMGKLLIHKCDDKYSFDIDSQEDYQEIMLFLNNGSIEFPWMKI